MRLSVVTVCKGRLHHLRQTAPLIAAQGPDEHIIVDYDCQDHCGEWVEQNLAAASVVRTTDPRGFCLARGRNLGAAAATGDFIFFADADILIEPGLIDWIRANVQPRRFYNAPHYPEGSHSQTDGSFVCSRTLFESVGGYDEAIRGWGREDTDLYRRLKQAASGDMLPEGFMTAIRHGDAERTREYNSEPFNVLADRTALYIDIKHQAGRLLSYPLPACCREALFEQTAGIKYGSRPKHGGKSEPVRVALRCQTCVERGEKQQFFNMTWVRRYRLFGPRAPKYWID